MPAAGVPTAFSIDHAQQKGRLLAFESSELAKLGRSDVVIGLVKIAVIREIDHVEPQTDLARAAVMYKRNMEVAVDLEIEGKENREVLAVRNTNIVLPLINLGVRKPGMDVDDRAKNQRIGKTKRSPSHHTVWNIRRANTVGVGTDDRLLERDEEVSERIQISPRAAPDVGNVQI